MRLADPLRIDDTCINSQAAFPDLNHRSLAMADGMNVSYPHPLIEGSSAWKGCDLREQSSSWIYRLSAGEIEEIEAATEAALATGKEMAAISREDFPLPRFTVTLEAIRDDVLNGRGFTLIRGFPSGNYPFDRNALTFWGLGRHLGNPVSQNTRGHLLGHVRDVGLVAATNFRARASQSTERQLFHTDGCDVVGLMCLATAKCGGMSSLVSSMTVYNEMASRRPDLAERLFQPIAFDRRGEIREGEGEWFTMPIFNEHEGLLSVSFTHRNVGSSQRHADAPRNPQEAIDLFTSIAEEPDLRLDMNLEVGDMQFVHNHTILHDRTAYEDWAEPEKKRHLLRLWIAAEGARPLSEAFIARYGSIEVGNRGGIQAGDTVLKTPLVAD
jgi:Taurine catabolism dioxygenase TauD, TfdA family